MSFWNSKATIRHLTFDRFIGGPMDGVTDAPFRKLVREFSPEALLYTEIRHAACIVSEVGGLKVLKFAQSERPLNFQLATHDTEFLEQACEKILAVGVDCIDLNIGCPAKNVVGSGAGSALMSNLPQLKKVVQVMRKCLPIPFTVKMRAGFKEDNALEVAQLLQDCGVDALAIHPRLQTEKFKGEPNYAIAADVKKLISIPVFISGGIDEWSIAKMVYEHTGVDGFLIGRAMIGKPWKLKELKELSQGRSFKVDHVLVSACALKHFDYIIAHYGSHGAHIFKKHLSSYLKALDIGPEERNEIMMEQSGSVIQDRLMAISISR